MKYTRSFLLNTAVTIVMFFPVDPSSVETLLPKYTRTHFCGW